MKGTLLVLLGRFMATGGAVASNIVQLRICAELLKPDVSSSWLVLGSHMPSHHCSFCGLRQLASGRIPCHQQPSVH